MKEPTLTLNICAIVSRYMNYPKSIPTTKKTRRITRIYSKKINKNNVPTKKECTGISIGKGNRLNSTRVTIEVYMTK